MVLIDGLLSVYKSVLSGSSGAEFIVPVKFSGGVRDYLSSIVDELLVLKPSFIKSYADSYDLFGLLYHKPKREEVSESVPDAVLKLVSDYEFYGIFSGLRDLLVDDGVNSSDSNSLAACLFYLLFVFNVRGFDLSGLISRLNSHLTGDLYAFNSVGYNFYLDKVNGLRSDLLDDGFIINDFSSTGFNDLFDDCIVNYEFCSDVEGFTARLLEVIGAGFLFKMSDLYEVSFGSDYVFIHNID